ncbi:serine/threonine protein kinase [Cystobacter fuscus]|uniref:non-specific serine/threonine protein kinase n=1 Tax=Cystobacter fuscus TaxID=43 RepID=A0A250IXY1_9BACT|nr:serine/threonine-protein kinase [Cystobacter fuscus]ATB36594.1 serine/threonine protein kinase [Cystobacter fuscus]
MDSTAVVDPRIGTVLQERYRILQRISAGGMGVVYRGERIELGRAVAIKFLHSWMATEPSFQRRFQIEAQAMSRLSHPCCVSVIDFGVQDGAPFMVMDFVTGQPLRTLLRESGPLPVKRALGIVRQVLAGLAHAHAQNIVHRDIKPDNLILAEATGLGDQLRILDFGLAKLRDTVSGLTTGLAVGTPSYMAPEQIRAGEIDARTDLYAVGVLLFELLTGAKPFDSERMTEVMRQHQEDAPPTLGSIQPEAGFSQELEAVVHKAMAKKPGDRFQSASDFAAALDALPDVGAPSEAPRVKAHTPSPSSGHEATVPSRPQPKAAPDPRAPLPSRNKRPMLAVGAAGALLVGLGAALLWQTKQGPGTTEPSTAKGAPPTSGDRSASSAQEESVPPEDLPNIEQIERWVKEGERRRDQTLRALASLRAQYPQSAYAPYLEGHVNFDNLRWADGLASYGAAMRNNAAYRTDAKLIRNVIRCLVSDGFHTRCADFLVREVGAPAEPFLEEAARSDSYANVRARASNLLRKMNTRR